MQIIQNKISNDSIFVFNNQALKKITANGVIFFKTAVNVNDKYFITDYTIFELTATNKIL